jgi:N-acetylmuramic acid 6-phosphate (MurNAc-6-P) etherase
MVELAAGVTRPMAVQALRDADGSVRLASVMAKKKISAAEAKKLLQRQTLREVLGQ